MTNKTPKILHEITPGEYLDINTAFDRHPALHGIQLETDTESTRESSAKTGETKTIHTTVGYGLWMSPAMFSALIKILNAAPADGDPLQAIVSLDLDTTANEAEREALVDYLSGNGYDATLENIAAGFVYNIDSLNALQVDAAGREYVVSRITTLTRAFHQKDITTPTIPETRLIVSAPFPDGSVMFTAKGKKIEEFVGEEYGGYRIVKVFEPGGYATNGGVILERIKEEED